MTPDAVAIHEADRKWFARAVGLGHWVYWILGTLAVLGFGCGAAGATWAWHEARTSSARTERYVVVLDADSAPIGSFALGVAGQMPAGAYIHFAREWLKLLRERSSDAIVGQKNAQKVIGSTDGRLYAQLRDSVQAANDIARSNAIDVLKVSANFLEPPADNTAFITVRWTEQIRNASSKPADWSATLKVVYVPNAVINEFSNPNLLGLYAQSFQPTLEN